MRHVTGGSFSGAYLVTSRALRAEMAIVADPLPLQWQRLLPAGIGVRSV
jgi:hypothetical protein